MTVQVRHHMAEHGALATKLSVMLPLTKTGARPA